MAQSRLKVGLAGAGVAGERHAAALRARADAELIGVHDTDSRRAAAFSGRFGAPALGFDALLDACDALIVASPAATHGPLGLAALERGRHVLVERPLAASRAAADAMAREAAARGLVLQAGHREGPMLAALGLDAPGEPVRLFEAAREAPPREHAQDVSVVLDLMIQDLYVAARLFDAPAVSVRAAKLGGRGDTVDAAEARIRFRGGGEARLRASRTATLRVAWWRVETRGGASLHADFVRGQSRAEQGWPDPGAWRLQDFDPVAQGLDAFVEACRGRATPEPVGPALAALDLALHVDRVVSSGH